MIIYVEHLLQSWVHEKCFINGSNYDCHSPFTLPTSTKVPTSVPLLRLFHLPRNSLTSSPQVQIVSTLHDPAPKWPLPQNYSWLPLSCPAPFPPKLSILYLCLFSGTRQLLPFTRTIGVSYLSHWMGSSRGESTALIHCSAQPSDAEYTVVFLNDFIFKSRFLKTIADVTLRTHGDWKICKYSINFPKWGKGRHWWYQATYLSLELWQNSQVNHQVSACQETSKWSWEVRKLCQGYLGLTLFSDYVGLWSSAKLWQGSSHCPCEQVG